MNLDTNLDTTSFKTLLDTITGRISKCKPANLIDAGPYLSNPAEHTTIAMGAHRPFLQIRAHNFTNYFVNKHFIVFTKLPAESL